MIARLWRGVAIAGNAEAYQRHATGTVFPALRDIGVPISSRERWTAAPNS